jgi:hypothetical protein
MLVGTFVTNTVFLGEPGGVTHSLAVAVRAKQTSPRAWQAISGSRANAGRRWVAGVGTRRPPEDVQQNDRARAGSRNLLAISRTRCAGARPSRTARRVSRGAGPPLSGAIPCRLRNPPSKHETGRPTADSPASGGGFVRCSTRHESEQTRGAGRPVAVGSSRGSIRVPPAARRALAWARSSAERRTDPGT